MNVYKNARLTPSGRALLADITYNSKSAKMMCAVLALAASGYYAWRGRPESQRSVANRALTEDIRLIHAESSGRYGSPRMHATLRRHGRLIGQSWVERLMRRAGLRGMAALRRRARTTSRKRPIPYDVVACRRRNTVERLWARLNHYRQAVTSYDKLGANYLSGVLIAAIACYWAH